MGRLVTDAAQWRIPLSDVRVSAAQMDAVRKVLESGWLSMGPEVAAFEGAFAAAAGVEHAVAVSNGTAALLLSLQAAGVGPGDEVVLPSLTFVACANSVRALGATPVFADITSAERPLLDSDDATDAFTERTRAVMAVHYGGGRAGSGLSQPCQEMGIALIEDAAHAAGPAADDGRWLPLTGVTAGYSFFANKNLPLGEGGMVACGNDTTASRIRLLRAHGMTTGTWDRHRGHASDYDVVAVGWNFRMTEMQAAMGRTGLSELPEWNRARRRLLRRYTESFDGSPVVMANASTGGTTAHLAVAVLPGPGLRPAVRRALAERRIQSSFHYPPIHRFRAYADVRARPLPRTEAAAGRLVTLPLHPWMGEGEVDEICSVVVKAAS